MTLPKNVNEWMHDLLEEATGEVAVDLTVGNGHDTLFLTQLGFRVYGFDIQEVALERTRALLEEHGNNLAELYCTSHEYVADFVQEEVDVVVMNLGYLPGGDKSIVTKGESTIIAIHESLSLLKEDGLFFVALYKSHPGAEEEVHRVEAYIKSLPQNEVHVSKISFPNQINTPPDLYILEKRL